MLVGMFLIPAAYLIGVGYFFFKGERRGLALSVVFFALSIAAGCWAITRSRSSTAGIGVLFLPLLGALAGLLALAFAHWRTSGDAISRVAAWLSLAGAVIVVASQLVQGQRSIQLNRSRDEEQAAHSAAIAREREALAETMRRSAGRETAVVDSMVRARMRDRAFLIAALESPHLSPDVLDSAARSADLGVALQAVRNPNADSATLARVYREHSYPDYFFQALAGHAHTPPAILRELYARPRTITGLDIWFAQNPATPRDVLERIASTTTDASVVQSLLRNPALDCALLTRAAERLAATDRPADEYGRSRVRELQPALCGAGADTVGATR